MHSLLRLAAFVLVASSSAVYVSAAGPDCKSFNEMFFTEQKTLQNVPVVTPPDRLVGKFSVAVTNRGKTILTYSGRGGPAGVSLYYERFTDGKWCAGTWDWCGTGRGMFEIAPGQTVKLDVVLWDNGVRDRALAAFSEKDTDRTALVVLAEETP
jgi:hypothetical protein